MQFDKFCINLSNLIVQLGANQCYTFILVYSGNALVYIVARMQWNNTTSRWEKWSSSTRMSKKPSVNNVIIVAGIHYFLTCNAKMHVRLIKMYKIKANNIFMFFKLENFLNISGTMENSLCIDTVHSMKCILFHQCNTVWARK